MSQQQCCGISRVFNDREARKMLRRFRRKGPDKTTRILIDELRRTMSVEADRDLTLLDIGAGIGAIHHELLDGTVSHAVHVDASPSHMAAARTETEHRGHTSVVDFVEGDFTAMADRVADADVVTLDRVICCFDDIERLVRLSAGKARRFYGAVYPRDVWWMHMGIGLINLIQRVQRSPFRVFLHDPDVIDGMLRAAGLRRHSVRYTAGWQAVVYARAS